MMIGRAASQRGYLMPERQYPIRIPPVVPGAAPQAGTYYVSLVGKTKFSGVSVRGSFTAP